MTIRVVHANDPLALVTVGDRSAMWGVTYSAPSTAVYIGRATRRANNPIAHVDSPWRNPWSIPDLMRNGVRSEGAARRAALDGYRNWLTASDPTGILVERERRDWIVEHVHELAGAVLVCWCAKPGHPLTHGDATVCHGQILAGMAES